MSDEFNPDTPLETQDDYDAYLGWCHDRLHELTHERVPRIVKSATYCAQWLLVLAAAPIHLDDSIEKDREDINENLSKLSKLARCMERDHDHVTTQDVLVARMVLDCWRPSGKHAEYVLAAAKCACSAIILLQGKALVMPITELTTIECPDVWLLVNEGIESLNEPLADAERTPQDFSVLPRQDLIDALQWARINKENARFGGPPLSPN